MPNSLIARGQVSIVVHKDAYTITQSVGQYIFAADDAGTIQREISLVSLISVRRGDEVILDFSIGTITPPVGFAAVITDNLQRTVTYTVAAGTDDLPDNGTLAIPILIGGQRYDLSFCWAKSKQGVPGTEGSLLDWVADWDNNRTQIDAATLITPKLFAGVKNADGTLTGSALGHFTLKAVDEQGTVITETIDGIYGFREGRKTFALDSTGSVVLGRGDQCVTYNALTGRIEFGADVSLTWINAIGQSKTEAIDTAAATAQDKADAALGSAKVYADTKKTEAVAEAGTAADTKIGTLATTLGSTIADAKKAGTDARAVADAITSKATSEEWSSKLTYIDGSGIFTGTLSAGTVNAIRIDASQITTGTLSAQIVAALRLDAAQITTGTLDAERIAAGSIRAEKLDAASLKAGIINADYISGLNCTFSRGTVGGFTIGSTAISGDHLCLDSANRRIAVYDSASSSITGKRVQLYYNTDTNFGLYVTNPAGGRIVQLGSENIIAGWNVDESHIWKNNVSLGADGSIANGTKWQLGNDGSGRLAGGNISWDAAGAVTFSESVSLNWRKNYGYSYYQSIVLYGDPHTYYPVVIKGGDQSLKRELLVRRVFHEQAPIEWGGPDASHQGGLTLRIKANFGGWGGSVYSWDIYDMEEVYANTFAGAAHCGNYCMFAIFLRGGGPGGAIYHLYSDQALVNSDYSPAPIPPSPQICYDGDQIFNYAGSSAYAPSPRTLTDQVQEEIRRHKFITLAQSCDTTLTEHPLTYIGPTGIYTGTLTASQVNAVIIDAASIRTGILSAERIAAGSIDSSKLNADSIKANIINTEYINGLSCTFVRGRIGGWNIEPGRLYSTADTLGNSVCFNAGGLLFHDLGGTHAWELKPDGAALFSMGRVNFGNDGSGFVAGGNVSWDAAGNVTMTGTINANAGTIGGFTIGQGRIGSTVTDGEGGGLAIYDDLFRVGGSERYALLGDNVIPASLGGLSATGRIVNEAYNSYNTNIGIHITVANASQNYGIYSNAPLLAPCHPRTRLKILGFAGTGYEMDFSQNDLYIVHADRAYNINLPNEWSVAYMFGLSTLPQDFCCIFTMVYALNNDNLITVVGVYNNDGSSQNVGMGKGDVLTLMVAKYPYFHYQIMHYQLHSNY